jgi:hypothetical protein
MTKWSGLGDSTELSRVGLSQNSPENSAKFRSTTNTPTLSLDPTPTRTRRLRGPSHVSRLSSHRVQTPHSTSTFHTASATPARPMRRLSLRVGHRFRLHFGLQPRLRLLLGLLLQVRLRIGPRRARVRNVHDRATAVRTSYRPGYNIYTRREIRLLARPQACRPDRRELTLRRLPRLTSLPGGNTIISSRGVHSNRGGNY